MYLLDIVQLNNNNSMIYVLFFILIVVFIAILLLLYFQNKEIKENMARNNIIKNKEENILLNSEDREETVEATPEVEEELNDLEDLQSLTRELEMLPKERVINMTPYEMEQEEKAIISYDELISQADNESISYSNETSPYEDLVIKQVDLEKTSNIELDPIKKELNSKTNVNTYEHEEEFLKILKQLNNLLN